MLADGHQGAARQHSPIQETPMITTASRIRRNLLASPRFERLSRYLFVLPAALYLGLFFGYPVVKNLVMGSQRYTMMSFVTGEAPWVGLDNYRAVIGTETFSEAALHTVFFTVFSIVLQFICGMGLALYFRQRFPLSNGLRSLILLPWLIPLIASSAVWKWMLDQDSGAINRLIDLLPGMQARPGWLVEEGLALVAVTIVNIWIGIPFNTAILHSGLQEIPDELYEAAALDGAVGGKAFRYVTWPLLRPVVTVIMVLGVVYTLKVLDIILALTNGGPAGSTETFATLAYHLSFREFDFGRGAAMGNVMIAVALAFALAYLRLNRKSVDE